MTLGVGKTDFTLETGAPVESVRCVAGPSEPHASPAWGESAWRLVSHLSLNHLSLGNAQDGSGRGPAAPAPAPLRRSRLGRAASRDRRRTLGRVRVRHADACRSTARPASRAAWSSRWTATKPTSKAASSFLLGAVLERFFARWSGSTRSPKPCCRPRSGGDHAMAGENRTAFDRVVWLKALRPTPVCLRLPSGAAPRGGGVSRRCRAGARRRNPRDEPLRLGQDPSFDFTPSAVRAFTPPTDDARRG